MMNVLNGRSAALESKRDKLLLLFLFLLAVFSLRLFYLQVVKHAYYKKLALSNRIQRERIIAPRGLVFDRNGERLVVNMPVYQIDILPRVALERIQRLELACRLLGVDAEKLKRDIESWLERYPDGREMTVVQSADKEQISVLRENRDIFPFFKLLMKPRRYYPEGDTATHLLGYIGEVTEEDIRKDGNLHRGDIIGRTGVEYAYNRYLTGMDGVRIVEIGSNGSNAAEVELSTGVFSGIAGSKPPVPGSDVYLTIDLELQRIVEDAFTWNRGAVVVLDPSSGEILAAVSKPSYNPNIFLKGLSDEEWSELNRDPSKPLFNRIVQALYPPGSVFKLVTAYAAVTDHVISRHQRLKPCFGAYRFGNRYFGCWKPEGHGLLDIHGAIVESCDVFFYQLGEKLTADQFAEAGRLFGLGMRTNVDLPGESAGILPDHRYYDRRYGERKWTQGLMLNYSIGQGEVLTTPLQLAVLTAVIANGGRAIRPHVVGRVVDYKGRVVYSAETAGEFIRGIDRGVLRLIREAMIDVVQGEKGTGKAARVPGLTVAGKTGTAQNPHGEDHAVFVAFAPAEKPKLVVSIVLENAGHGGEHAAPIAAKIFSGYLSSITVDRGGGAGTGVVE